MSAPHLVRVQALLNIALPVFAAFYFHFTVADHGLEDLKGAEFAVILPMLFIAMMQLVCLAEKGQALPAGRLASGIGLPFLIIGLAALADGVTLGWYLFEMGALYTMAIILAFLGLVFVRPFLSGVAASYTPREALGYVGMALLQLVFIVPGLIVCAVYLRLLAAQGSNDATTADSTTGQILFAIALMQLLVHEYRWMDKASPNLRGSRNRDRAAS